MERTLGSAAGRVSRGRTKPANQPTKLAQQPTANGRHDFRLQRQVSSSLTLLRTHSGTAASGNSTVAAAAPALCSVSR